MQPLIRKRLIAALAAISGLSTGLTLAGGLLSPLDAQCGGGGGGQTCEKNLCSFEGGNCYPTDVAEYKCNETVVEPGCEDSPCD